MLKPDELNELFEELKNPLSWHWKVDIHDGWFSHRYSRGTSNQIHQILHDLDKERTVEAKEQANEILNFLISIRKLFIMKNQLLSLPTIGINKSRYVDVIEAIDMIIGNVSDKNYLKRKEYLRVQGFPVEQPEYQDLLELLIKNWDLTLQCHPNEILIVFLPKYSPYIKKRETLVKFLKLLNINSTINFHLNSLINIVTCEEDFLALMHIMACLQFGSYDFLKELPTISTSKGAYFGLIEIANAFPDPDSKNPFFSKLILYRNKMFDLIDCLIVCKELIKNDLNMLRKVCLILTDAINKLDFKKFDNLSQFLKFSFTIMLNEIVIENILEILDIVNEMDILAVVMLNKKLYTLDELRQLKKEIENLKKSEFNTREIQKLNKLGIICVSSTNAYGGGDPFENIKQVISKFSRHGNPSEFNPSASLIRKGGVSSVAITDIGKKYGGSIGVIFDYGFIYDSRLFDSYSIEKEVLSGFFRKVANRAIDTSVAVVANRSDSKYNEILLSKHSVGALFYTKGTNVDVVEKLKIICDEESFKEQFNGAHFYLNRLNFLNRAPKKIIKIFPLFEIDVETNDSTLVYMPKNPNPAKYELVHEEDSMTWSVRLK